MARRIHIVPAEDETNGVWRVANMLAAEDGGTVQLGCDELVNADEVWVHGMWLPREWRACCRALCLGKRLVRMTHGSLSPVYLRYHGWKKFLVGPIERFFLRRASLIVATCEAEAGWIRSYLGHRCPPIEVSDIKRFFDFNRVGRVETCRGGGGDGCVDGGLHILYLGRRHPLKGVDCLEAAVRQIQDSTRSTCSTRLKIDLRVVSNAFGEEKEKVWDWCDVLALPTLSENFGLVIAEALERDKRVITTDGAPAWECECKVESEKCKVGDAWSIWQGYDGRLIYLKGYRDGSDEERVELLKSAIEMLCRAEHKS